MEIKFTPFLYVVSLAFSISQLIYAIIKIIILKKQTNTKKIRIYQILTMSMYFTSILLWNVYNFIGIYAGYIQKTVKYRTNNPNYLEMLLQMNELIFDAMQKSAVLLSILFFLPVFKNANYFFTDEPPSDTLEHFIIIYALVRIVIHICIYIILLSNPEFATFIIDTLYISECILLFFVFVSILVQYKRILNKQHFLYRFRRIVFESTVKGFSLLLILILCELSFDLSYKLGVVISGLISESTFSYLLLDYIYVIRLISLNLQYYCVFKICYSPNLSVFEAGKGVKEELEISGNGFLEAVEQNLYPNYVQPNSGTKSKAFDEIKNTKINEEIEKFTLF